LAAGLQLKAVVPMSGKAPKSGRDLERQVADVYRAMGAREVKHDVELAGNQIDVYVEMESADRGLHRIAVEVKNWRKTVGIDVINDFVRVVDNLRNTAKLIDEGVIVSASGFSKQARNAAETYGIRLLEPADLAASESGREGGQAMSKQYATHVGDVSGPVHTGQGDIIILPAEAQPPSTHPPGLPTGIGPTDLEFANRKAELRTLLSPIDNPGAPRYVQVYAPSGLGKTYLLRRARNEYEAAGWLCAWLDFTHVNLCLQTKLIREQLGEQFGAEAEEMHTCADVAQQVMRVRRPSVVFLDAVDLASGEVRRWIKTDLIPDLEGRIPDPKLRPYFIAAGRHPIREWAVYSMQRFECIRLTPFNDTVVDDLLRRFADRAGYELSDDFFQRMTGAILFITKGHPACIKRVLQEIQSHEFTMPPHEVTQASTFNQTVGALLDEEILVLHVLERCREAFKSLCALRGYTPNLLDRLAEGGWVPAREHIDWDLESELQGTYLVEVPDSNPLYRIEPLIRQLVALQMEYNDEDKFLGLNRAALEIFEEQVKGKDKNGDELPNRPYDRMQVALAVEALYHQATLLRQDKVDTRGARGKLCGKVQEYLSYRLTHESDNYWVSLLLETLEKDAELTALIYGLTGKGGLEFVLQPLYDLSRV